MSVLAIVFEVLLIQIQEDVYHFAGREGVEGHQTCEHNVGALTGVFLMDLHGSRLAWGAKKTHKAKRMHKYASPGAQSSKA